MELYAEDSGCNVLARVPNLRRASEEAGYFSINHILFFNQLRKLNQIIH